MSENALFKASNLIVNTKTQHMEVNFQLCDIGDADGGDVNWEAIVNDLSREHRWQRY